MIFDDMGSIEMSNEGHGFSSELYFINRACYELSLFDIDMYRKSCSISFNIYLMTLHLIT